MRIRRTAPLALLAALLLGAPAAPAAAADPQPAITHHSVTLGGRAIAYTAKAGTITLKNDAGEPIADVFSVAYLADGADARTRPVTFIWNGGPGSSSMWLHMGSYAPVRVDVPSNGVAPRPDAPLVPNADSLLDTSDLVFIDAIGTGYSRITGKGDGKMFFGIDEDAKAFTSFIRDWLGENNRWSSPKFLFGESYGTTRAANVVNRLQNAGVGVDGVVLLSSVLDYNALDNNQGPGEDQQYVSFLPTEAAVAWYHHKVAGNPPGLARFLDDVRAFAGGPYAQALMRGDQLDATTRAGIIAKLHDYTGLDAAYVDRANLRLDPGRFEHELLHTTGEITGRLDGRYQGYEEDRTGDSASYDPTSDDTLSDAFVSDFSQYVRNDLNYKVDRPYFGTNYGLVGAHWNFRRLDHRPVAPNVAADLRNALIKNPYLHVFAANGYFDLATPFYGTEYTLAHLGLPQALRPHITYGYYPSGHMVYLNGEARHAFKTDLARFYREAMVH